MEGISPPTITLAFADFEEIHPLSSLALIRLVVPRLSHHDVTPSISSDVVRVFYTPFGCAVTPLRVRLTLSM